MGYILLEAKFLQLIYTMTRKTLSIDMLVMFVGSQKYTYEGSCTFEAGLNQSLS